MRGDISLADVFVVFDALDPHDAATGRAIVRLLGLEGALDAPAGPPAGGYDPRLSPERKARHGPAAARMPSPPALSPRPTPPQPEGDPLPVRLEPLDTPSATTSPPAWLTDDAIPMLDTPPERSATPPRPPSLFDARRQRALLGAALATRAPEGALDVDALLDRVARLQPITQVPRHPVPTLRRGVQLLLDHAEAMLPYAQDRDALVKAVEDVAGAPRVAVFHFEGCPTRSVTRTRSFEPTPWRPPPRGTVVAVVSDLGIGGRRLSGDRADRHEWLDFARRARAGGCPVVAFVPFAPSRWDPHLARAMTLIHWDRPTTARAVRRAVGPGHRL